MKEYLLAVLVLAFSLSTVSYVDVAYADTLQVQTYSDLDTQSALGTESDTTQIQPRQTTTMGSDGLGVIEQIGTAQTSHIIISEQTVNWNVGTSDGIEFIELNEKIEINHPDHDPQTNTLSQSQVSPVSQVSQLQVVSPVSQVSLVSQVSQVSLVSQTSVSQVSQFCLI